MSKFSNNAGLMDDDVQEFLAGRQWVFIIEDAGILHSMSGLGKMICSVDYSGYRNPKFLEAYNMCEKCIEGFPMFMQRLMTRTVSSRVRERAMAEDHDLPDKIFDMEPNKFLQKVEEEN